MKENVGTFIIDAVIAGIIKNAKELNMTPEEAFSKIVKDYQKRHRTCAAGQASRL